MRLVIQRVKEASGSIGGEVVSSIGKGLTIALAGSKSGISRCENIHGLVGECGRTWA